jgi:hypothetical protein
MTLGWKPLATYLAAMCEKHGLPAPKVGELDWQPKIRALIELLDAKASQKEEIK